MFFNFLLRRWGVKNKFEQTKQHEKQYSWIRAMFSSQSSIKFIMPKAGFFTVYR